MCRMRKLTLPAIAVVCDSARLFSSLFLTLFMRLALPRRLSPLQLQELKGNIRVVVRVKPCLPGCLPSIEVPAPALSSTSLGEMPSSLGLGQGGELYAVHPTLRSLKPFAFDVVLGPTASQARR